MTNQVSNNSEKEWVFLSVDKDIPLPPVDRNPNKNGVKAIQYSLPMKIMRVGDSFFIPNAKHAPKSQINKIKKDFGYLFAFRFREEDGVSGVRVWRVK